MHSDSEGSRPVFGHIQETDGTLVDSTLVENTLVASPPDSSKRTLPVDYDYIVNYAPTAHNIIMGSSGKATELEGQLHVYDSNTGEALIFSLVTPPSSGQLRLNSDGSFRFLPGADFGYLTPGEQATVTFVFKVLNSSGASSHASVDITIKGVHGVPEVAKPVSIDIVQNDDAIIIDLLYPSADKDRSGSLSVTRLRLTEGNEAGVDIGLDSSRLSIDLEAYQYLAEDESETLAYEYLVTDSRGESVWQSITITLSGTHGQPQVREAIIQALNQNSDHLDIGLLAGAFDRDATDTVNVVSLQLSAGDPVSITVADDGNNLSVDASTDEHRPGESEQMTYSNEVDDGHDDLVSQSAVIILVTPDEDTPYLFTASDFIFPGPGVDQISPMPIAKEKRFSPPSIMTNDRAKCFSWQSIKITRLASAGKLLYNKSAVTPGMEVTKNDLLAGRLRFEPAKDENGHLFASFEFQVSNESLTDTRPFTVYLTDNINNDAPGTQDDHLDSDQVL